MKKKLFILIVCIFLLFWLIAPLVALKKDSSADDALTIQVENLQKLCKVWGFVGYTHKAFLTGKKDCDEELLKLIPVIRFADKKEVNDILYDWFVGLGDDGYDLDWEAYRSSLLEAYEEYPDTYTSVSDFMEGREIQSWADMQAFNEEWWLFTTGNELNMHQMADTSWINKRYLGGSLFAALSRFHEIQIIDRPNAPGSFGKTGNSIYHNESNLGNVGEDEYRLLGLFRLWNAIEYYYPYMDILDDDWNSLLLGFIPKMLEGKDKLSYELTLAELTSKLHDGHINPLMVYQDIFNIKYGKLLAPVKLTEIEGQLVVSDVAHEYRNQYSLMPGDVVLAVDGTGINNIVEDMLQYVSYPNKEKALDYLSMNVPIIRSNKNFVEVDVLRGDTELRFELETFSAISNLNWTPVANQSHVILENNIGLINPSLLKQNEIDNIMQSFADTNGIIVDLRQYPSVDLMYSLAEYLVYESKSFAVILSPYQPIPGVFVDSICYSGGTQSPDAYFYDKNVIILINEETASNPEFVTMSLRNGSHITVMGSNSLGADGNVVTLPLPGGITMRYTGLGVLSPEGGQTQRIGLSPDIYVHQTIKGLREGRDELMEAAIQYLINSH